LKQLRAFPLKRLSMSLIAKRLPAAGAAAALLMAALVCARSQAADKGRTEYMDNCAGGLTANIHQLHRPMNCPLYRPAAMKTAP
jgi:hypothetical protein